MEVVTLIPISDILPWYTLELSKKGVAQGTIRNYRYCLQKLHCIDIADPGGITAVMNELIGEYHSTGNSCHVKRAAYWNLLKLLEYDEWANRLVCYRIKPRKIYKKWLTNEQVNILVKSMQSDPQVQLASLLAHQFCARAMEILNITGKDLFLETKQVKITRWKILSRNPGAATQLMTLSDSALEMMCAYLYNRGMLDLSGKILTDDKIFTIKYWDFWDRFTDFTLNALGSDLITPHWLRASMAVFLIRQVGIYDLNSVCEYGGWSDISSLQDYLRGSGIKAEEIMKREQEKLYK